MKVIDNRLKPNIHTLTVGDILVDVENDMYMVVGTHNYSDFRYGLICLEDLTVSIAEDSLDNLLIIFKSDYGLKEIVPQEKISITIS